MMDLGKPGTHSMMLVTCNFGMGSHGLFLCLQLLSGRVLSEYLTPSLNLDEKSWGKSGDLHLLCHIHNPTLV